MPAAMPVTMPVAVPTDAKPPVVLVQLPPVVMSLNVVVAPMQTDGVPVMGSEEG